MTKIRVAVIEPEKRINIIDIEDSNDSFIEIVGGYYESLTTRIKGCKVLVNENGRFLNLERNAFDLFGTIIAVGEEDYKYTSLTDDQISKLEVLYSLDTGKEMKGELED